MYSVPVDPGEACLSAIIKGNSSIFYEIWQSLLDHLPSNLLLKVCPHLVFTNTSYCLISFFDMTLMQTIMCMIQMCVDIIHVHYYYFVI